jgi:DNA-binding response OmpR family regulator
VEQQEKVSLLIVDDDAPIRKLLERVALRAGFDVDSAKDGLEALELIERKQYAIAIIDLMMPRLSGYELVQKISTLNPRPVVIVATALTNGDVAKIDDTLVRRVIKKPFDVKAVAESLIETARQIAEKDESARKQIPVITADAMLLKVDSNTMVKIEPSPEEKPKEVPPEEEKKDPAKDKDRPSQ